MIPVRYPLHIDRATGERAAPLAPGLLLRARPGPDRRRRGRGFTLIELLVALFIAALMFAMGYGAINQALRSRGSIRHHQQDLLELQTAMRVIEQDFVQLAPRPVRQPLGDGWLPCLLASSTSQPLVTLTRGGWSNPTGLQRTELERVAYVFDNGTLVREHWNVLDATLSSTPVKLNLMKRLKSVTFSFMTGDTRQWVDQWPTPTSSSLAGQDAYYRLRPIAVEVTFDTKEWGKVVRVFEIAG